MMNVRASETSGIPEQDPHLPEASICLLPNVYLYLGGLQDGKQEAFHVCLLISLLCALATGKIFWTN